MQPQQLGF